MSAFWQFICHLSLNGRNPELLTARDIVLSAEFTKKGQTAEVNKWAVRWSELS